MRLAKLLANTGGDYLLLVRSRVKMQEVYQLLGIKLTRISTLSLAEGIEPRSFLLG